MTARYESPEVKIELSKEEIQKRYQDTSLIIFKEHTNKKEIVNYLSIGTSRRTMEYSSYGNQPVIIRRPARTLVAHSTGNLPSQIFQFYHKPRESCTIN